MLHIIIPGAIVALCCGSYLRKNKDYGVMTAERMKMYNAALSGSLKNPEDLRQLSVVFEKEGLKDQAKLLRQRAALRELPADVKAERRKIWKKAVKSRNKSAVMELAQAYDDEGCTAAAMRLREYASGLQDAPDANGAPTPSAEPPAETAK